MFNRYAQNCLLLLIIAAMICIAGCSTKIEKLPITTISDDARKLYQKGIVLSDRLRSKEAVSYFEDAIALDSNFAMAYIGLAFAQRNPTQLLSNLQKAINLRSVVTEGEQLWIDATEAQINNQTELQRTFLQKIINLYPDDERVRNFLGTTYFVTQEYQESIEHYLKALEINPKYSQVYNQLGYAYRFLQNYNEAEKMFQQYIELIPNDPNPYDSYGELLLQIGKFDESIANYEKALQVDPYFTFSYLGISSNLNYKNEHVKARNRLQKLLTTAKDDNQKRTAYNGMIISLIDEGNLLDALKMTEEMKMIAINASDTLTILNDNIPHGDLYLEMDNPIEARKLFNSSHVFIENSSFTEKLKQNALNNLKTNIILVDIKENKFSEAKQKTSEYAEYAKEQENPNLIRLGNQLYGTLAFAEKNYEKAIDYLRQSNQSNPSNIYLMALAYEQIGDTERAQSFFYKAAHANLVASRHYSFIRKKALAKIIE